DVLGEIDKVIGVPGGEGLWPPEDGRGNPNYKEPAQLARLCLVRDVMFAVPRHHALGPAFGKVLQIVFRHLGFGELSEKTIKPFLSRGRKSEPDDAAE